MGLSGALARASATTRRRGRSSPSAVRKDNARAADRSPSARSASSGRRPSEDLGRQAGPDGRDGASSPSPASGCCCSCGCPSAARSRSSRRATVPGRLPGGDDAGRAGRRPRSPACRSARSSRRSATRAATGRWPRSRWSASTRRSAATRGPILRQKTLLGETYVELTPGHQGRADDPRGRRGCANARDRARPSSSTRCSRSSRRRRAPRFRRWQANGARRDQGPRPRTSTTRSATSAPFAESGADLLTVLDRRREALRRPGAATPASSSRR